MSGNAKLYEIAANIMMPGMGILAADESTSTMNKRLASIGVAENAEMRRKYRQLLFTCPGSEKYISGTILYDASIRNHTDDGTPFPEVLIAKGITPIIKVDKSTCPHTGFPNEVVTQGLDGLADRLKEYYDLGARAAKWRAVIKIGDGIPTEQNVLFDCIQLARYAALCHESGIVPMVEPEVLLDGNHDIGRAEEVTTMVLKKLFDILTWYRIDLRAVILKSSMVLAGSECHDSSSPVEVADATLRTFHNSVPHEVAGIVFLSGGQTPIRATENLQEIASRGNQPWPISYSYSRAIEEPILDVWRGQEEQVAAAQDVMIHRLIMNSKAQKGEYTGE